MISIEDIMEESESEEDQNDTNTNPLFMQHETMPMYLLHLIFQFSWKWIIHMTTT